MVLNRRQQCGLFVVFLLLVVVAVLPWIFPIRAPQGPLPINAAQAANRVPPANVHPVLKILDRQDLSYGMGVTGLTWRIQGNMVGYFNARLCLYEKGKRQINDDIECQWNTPATEVDAKLTLLIQSGEPFGVKGKRFPLLGVSFDSAKPDVCGTSHRSALIADHAHHSSQGTTKADGFLAGRTIPLYRELSGSLDGSAPLWNESDEGMMEYSKTQGDILVVQIEWGPDKKHEPPENLKPGIPR